MIEEELARLYIKLAEISTELKPHQQRVVDRIKAQPGLVVAHGMGSGKTLTSIAAAEQIGGPTSVTVPAALQTNYQKEIAKHVTGTPKAQYGIDSLQRAALSQQIAPSKLHIIDEAHRIRDPASKARKAVRGAETEKRMLLTGTPLYNRPYDLASLVNVAAGENVFPGAQADFDRRYIGEKVVKPGWFARTFRGVKPGSIPVLKNEQELGKTLGQWVDFHENSTEGFPARRDEVVNTEMSKQQRDVYETMMKTAPAWVRYKVRHGLPPSKQESKDLNAFLSGARQVSNSPAGFEEGLTPDQAALMSPKLQEAFNRLSTRIGQNPQHRALVYSNFLESGLHPYETLLKTKNIPYGKFTGELGKAERDAMVKAYNDGQLKALLLSSAGGEGLDLKGTRQIQVLEPHFNREKLEQVIARGIRYKSHDHLPDDQRNVDVEHYVSQLPKPNLLRRMIGAKRDGSVDEYLRTLSSQKDELNQQVRALLRQGTEQHTKTSSLRRTPTEKLRYALDPRRIAGDLFGSVDIAHATGPDAAKKVRAEGLRASLGGTGGEGYARYLQDSEGKVHVAVPSASFGRVSALDRYAEHGARREAAARLGLDLKNMYDGHPREAELEAAVRSAPGEVLHGAMPFRSFTKRFQADNTMLPGDAAYSSSQDVGAEHFGDSTFRGQMKSLWKHRDRDLWGYAKEHPKRFARGAAVPAVAGVALGGGILAAQHEAKKRKTASLSELSATYCDLVSTLW